MTKSFAVLFQLKRTKKLSNGTAPIYLRITINKERVEIATKRSILPEKWNVSAQKAIGNSEDSRSINNYLKTLEQKAYECYREMIEENLPISAQAIKHKINGIEEDEMCRMLIQIFEDHNKKIEALIGKEYAAATATRYATTLKHLTNFLKWKYKISDIDIKKLDHEFVTSFEFYLRTERSCNNNSTVKYIKNLKKVIHICVANDWLHRSPFINYKGKIKEVIRDFLSMDDLDRINEKQFATERLNHVKDVFLFSCYTGLAYADVFKLKHSEINIGINNQKWIFTSRQKTETPSRIPLIPEAIAILERYKNHPDCVSQGKVLPVLSNQKMNAYLKEIADICEIKKELTFHVARHTFATSVTLANGVSIESVSKMLGHKNIRTTQHYAKILDMKVAQDMDELTQKLQLRKTNLGQKR